MVTAGTMDRTTDRTIDRTILHCDLNNFFASVEICKHPEWQNVPMIVGGETDQRHGIVLAKNMLAKKCGIQTGESIYQARTKCPALVIAEPHYDEYLYYSRIVRQIYAGVTDQIEPMGIDECWLDVTASRDLFGSGYAIADRLRRTVKAETGLTISSGVSFNKVFAKLGSDMKKPDAITEIPPDRFREIVWPLPAFEMLGVGMKTYKKIYYRGCRTIGDIANTKVELLEAWLGKLGKVLWVYANGLENARVLWQTEAEPIKSIGHGTTTVLDLENETEVRYVLEELAEEVGTKLRMHGLSAGGVSVQIRENDMNVREYQCKLPHRTQLARELAGEGAALFHRKHMWRLPLRSVTIRAIDIDNAGVPEQLDLFTDHSRREKLLTLESTVDQIRERYGTHAITCGTYLAADKLSSRRFGYDREL